MVVLQSICVFMLCCVLSCSKIYAAFNVSITSDQQLALHDYYVFKNNAVLAIHDKYHVIADVIKVDTAKKVFIAESTSDFGVKIETKALLVYARFFEYDSSIGEGSVHGVTIHLPKGYVSAARALVHCDGSWELYDAMYTPCDAHRPHWRITADKLFLSSDSIDAYQATLIVKQCPVAYVPRVVMPLQNKSKTGLLFPTLSYHANSGPGFKQQYYWYIDRHADSTLGIDWQNKRGIFATANLRWARSVDESLLASGYLGRMWNVYVQRDNRIQLESRNRYWLQANDTRVLGRVGPADCYMLSRLDCGSDKKMGYQFFDSIQDVDDTFYNGAVVRGYTEQGMVDTHVEVIDTARKRFSELNERDKARIAQFAYISGQQGLDQEQKKELESRYAVWRLPHLEYNGQYVHWSYGTGYKQDCFIDRIAYNEIELEKIYALSKVALEEPLVPRNSSDLLRFEYHGSLYTTVLGKNNCLMLHCNPHYQARSKIAAARPEVHNGELPFTANGAQRLYVSTAAEWGLPDISYLSAEGYGHTVRPKVTWEFVPALYQKHWYAIDQFDCLYPKNEIVCSLNGSGLFDSISLQWSLAQGVDFFNNRSLLPMRRSLAGKTLLPFSSYCAVEKGSLGISNATEYDVRAGAIISSEFNTRVSIGKAHLAFGYLYYSVQAQENRKLLSNLPHYFFLHTALPLNKRAKLSYGGQFCIEQNAMLKPLIHQLKFEYDGHCWGFYLGFEEKVYRESGMPRRDQAFVLSVHFDSLGSVGKKFKSPYFTV